MITIQSVPADFASLHDDMWFVVSSDNIDQPNFKFVFDTYVGGNLAGRVKIVPGPSGEGSYGVFNAAPIVRNYLTNYFEPSGTSVLQHTSDRIRVDFQIQYGEEVSGTITADLEEGDYSGYNYYPPLFFDGILLLGDPDGDLLLEADGGNLLLGNYKDQWLTDRDTENIDLIFNKRLFISWLADIYDHVFVQVQKINQDGSNDGVAMTGDNMALDQFSLFDFSADAINEYFGTELIIEATYGYKVRLGFGYSSDDNILVQNVTNPSPSRGTITTITNVDDSTDTVFTDGEEGAVGAVVGANMLATAAPEGSWGPASGFIQMRVMKGTTEIYNQTSTAVFPGGPPADLTFPFTIESGWVYSVQVRSTGDPTDPWDDLSGGSPSISSGLYSNYLTIRHVCYANRTTPVNVHFLNMQGGWDTFGFNLINKRNTTFERTSFRRSQWQLSGNEMRNSDDFNRFNEGTINFSTQHKDGYTLASDYISEEDYHWLAQLVGSPIVYLEVRGAYFPIVMRTNNYEYKLEKSDGLFNLELEIEVAKYPNSQYR